jgi:NAD(P) transhydrogenase subunit beta
MVALYNGMGGGSAGAIGAVVLLGGEHDTVHMTLAILGGLIGTISFSGSLIAFAKLQGWADKQYIFPGQQLFNALVFIATVAAAGYLFVDLTPVNIAIFFGLAFAVGILMTLPIGGADMPVVISLYNALTGLAVAFEGFVLQNEAMIIAGTVVGAAGTLLTQLMARAMNRSLGNVLFSGFGTAGGGAALEGEMRPIEATDVAVMMGYADKVIIVPGYGMAVAQAQHKVWELTRQLLDRGVKVKFAIHPVAGRMPGHMNVLLAEADVPYDQLLDLDQTNNLLPRTDVVLVLGANDVVNPSARDDEGSPIYGMPILEVDQAATVIVVKRSLSPGFAGIDNPLFYREGTRMLFADAKQALTALGSALEDV